MKKILTALLAGLGLMAALPLYADASEFYYPPDEDGQLVVVIDPGHGGENLGADYNGFIEKDMNMTVANAMYEELTKYDGITVYMTHTQDVDMSLKERADFAASVNADFLFCLHFNMSPSNNLFGSEVWISAFEEENRQGYRFGTVQMQTMAEMGLYIRGVKTRFNDRGTDYYGILRHCQEYDIPAALIEHCHVDHIKDVGYCDSEEDLIAFGKADAVSAAKFFRLSSKELGISYADYDGLPETQEGRIYMQADQTAPDICLISEDYCDYENGIIGLTLTAQDPDTPMLYYSYSLDGGITYSELLAWPETDIMGGYSPDTFHFEVAAEPGTFPAVMVRAYNQYDRYAESNLLDGYQMFPYPEEPEALPAGNMDGAGITEGSTSDLEGTPKGREENRPVKEAGKEDLSLLVFLQICLVCVVLLFITLLITKAAGAKRHKKHRRR